jgi:hypothetical protein
MAGRVVMVLRNLGVERGLVEQACLGRVDPEALIEAMQRRAGLSEFGGDSVRVGIDWLLEAEAEAPDMANYIVWELLGHDDHDDQAKANLSLALRDIASAFNRVQYERARRLRED